MNVINIDYKVERPIIMIVEDHDILRKSLGDWLKDNFPNSHILNAKNGEEAVSLASEGRPDLIISDIGLPGINGLEAIRRIRKTLPDIKVVVVTIHDSPEYRSEANALGVMAYIPKYEMWTELIPALKIIFFGRKDN